MIGLGAIVIDLMFILQKCRTFAEVEEQMKTQIDTTEASQMQVSLRLTRDDEGTLGNRITDGRLLDWICTGWCTVMVVFII